MANKKTNDNDGKFIISETEKVIDTNESSDKISLELMEYTANETTYPSFTNFILNICEFKCIDNDMEKFIDILPIMRNKNIKTFKSNDLNAASIRVCSNLNDHLIEMQIKNAILELDNSFETSKNLCIYFNVFTPMSNINANEFKTKIQDAILNICFLKYHKSDDISININFYSVVNRELLDLGLPDKKKKKKSKKKGKKKK